MAIIFLLFAKNKKPASDHKRVYQMLKPLKSIRVWRFGLYYFLVFGCFVAFSQWLVPYFTNVYSVSLVVAGLFASLFSMPSGLIRALGGWLSDMYGGRKVMDWVFKFSIAFSLLLIFPKMDVFTPGKGISSTINGTVTLVSDSLIQVNQTSYPIQKKRDKTIDDNRSFFPTKSAWQEPSVTEGQEVVKKQVIALSTTHIHFSANIWIFAILTFAIGIVWGIGKAGVYKFIPDYFPDNIGAVGGMVGVIGGLGGFVCPILFGYLLEWTGLWTSSWLLMLIISLMCYIWLRQTIAKVLKKHAPGVIERVE